MRRLLKTIGFLAALFPPAASHAGPIDATVVSATWTDTVSNREPANQLDTAASFKALYLWTRIEAGPRALARLKQDGKLPIVHRWSRVVPGFGSWPERSETTDEIKLGENLKTLVGQLESEIVGRGVFDWRVWSSKTAVPPGRWKVDVLFADGTPVPCKEGVCGMLIEVR